MLGRELIDREEISRWCIDVRKEYKDDPDEDAVLYASTRVRTIWGLARSRAQDICIRWETEQNRADSWMHTAYDLMTRFPNLIQPETDREQG